MGWTYVPTRALNDGAWRCDACKGWVHGDTLADDLSTPCRTCALESEVTRLREENASQSYMGNSVSYIYDKMRCYQTQVGFAFAALRHLGWDGEGRDNAEREQRVRQWAEHRQSEATRLRAAIQAEIDGLELVAESCVRSGLGASTERRMIKAWQEVLGDG